MELPTSAIRRHRWAAIAAAAVLLLVLTAAAVTTSSHAGASRQVGVHSRDNDSTNTCVVLIQYNCCPLQDAHVVCAINVSTGLGRMGKQACILHMSIAMA